MNSTVEQGLPRLRERSGAMRAALDRARAALAASMPAPGRVNWLVLGPLLVGAAGFQFAMLRPPFPSDSLQYFGWAESIGGNEVSHGTTRLGVLAPVRVAIELFGPAEAAYYAAPFAMTLLTIGATYVVGVKLTGRQVVGTAAALLLAASTLVLRLSSQILPDPFAAAWFAAAMACFLSARGSPRRAGWLIAGAGALGLAYMSREYAVFLAPLVLFLAWVDRWKARDYAMVAAVLGAVLVGEVAMMAVLFGDPLARVRALTGFAERAVTGASPLLVAYGEGASRWTVLRRGPGAFAVFAMGKLLLLAIPAGILLAGFDRRRRGLWVLLLVWVGALWVPMMFLAGILDPQTPRIRDNHVRYWFLVIPALFVLMVGAAALTTDILRRARARWSVGILAGFLALAAVVADLGAVPAGQLFRAFGATQWDEVRDWLRTDGDRVDRIYTDHRMARVLPIYTREVFGDPIWNGEIVVFETDGEFLPVSELQGAVVLHQLGRRYLANRDLRVPAAYNDPGPGWEVEVRRADGSLTIVAPTDTDQAVLDYLALADRVTTTEIPPSALVVAGDARLAGADDIVTTGPDPQLRFDASLAFGPDDVLVLEMDTPRDTTVQLFWRSPDGAFSEADSMRVKVAAGTRHVALDLSAVPPASVLRLDPAEGPGFTVDDLAFVSVGGS